MSEKDSPNLRSFWDFPSARRSSSFRRLQQHFIESDHHSSSSRDCTNTADVPSFTRRIARSEIPLVSDRWSVFVRWFLDNSSQYLPKSNKLFVWITFGCCDGRRKLSWILLRLLWSFWFDTDSTEGLHLVPRQRIGDCSEIHVLRWGFCALLLSSHQTFLLTERSLITSSARNPRNFGFSSICHNFGLWWSEYKYCASVFVSPLLKHHLPSLRSLFHRNVRAHVSRFFRFNVKGYNQSGMPCVGSSLFISFAGSRFPRGLLVMICQHRFPACILVTSSCYWIY